MRKNHYRSTPMTGGEKLILLLILGNIVFWAALGSKLIASTMLLRGGGL